jgi:pimeloyl-ACP methyl ester carboxylesterase
VPAGLQKFYRQTLSWQPCKPQVAVQDGAATAAAAAKAVKGFQCTTLTVPLNYADPGGPTIGLAMNRLPAAGQAQRIGPLLTNPGGPGESGVKFVFGASSFFTSRLRARYDIVGMDPRGVGLSSQVLCKGTSQLDQQPTLTVAEAAQLARACQQTSGKILPYVGTGNAARDMDIARAALGASRLDYYGASYGTLLGQFYAQMFPRNVGRVVLDSVDNPTDSADPTTQVASFQSTFKRMVQTCVDHGNCPLGSSQSAALTRFDSKLRSSPPGSQQVIISLVQSDLYSESQWPALEGQLGAWFSGKPVAAPGGGTEQQSMPAIQCLTMPPATRTVAAATHATREAQAVAPYFWQSIEKSWVECAKWPVPSSPGAGQAIRAPGTPTMLLVNNIYDPATPVIWARQVHGQLANSILVTNIGAGHVFYQLGSCTHNVVDSFLISGAKPAPGTTCHDNDPALAPKTSGGGSTP